MVMNELKYHILGINLSFLFSFLFQILVEGLLTLLPLVLVVLGVKPMHLLWLVSQSSVQEGLLLGHLF
jgi:hypothetical protein